jgi:hypothetical protein
MVGYSSKKQGQSSKSSESGNNADVLGAIQTKKTRKRNDGGKENSSNAANITIIPQKVCFIGCAIGIK